MAAPRSIRAAVLAVLAVLAVIAGAGLCVGAVSPASAATLDAAEPVDLLVSADGVIFATNLDAGLFDDLGALVPTGEVAATLWIRNPTESAADLRVSARNVRLPPGTFADDVTVSVWDSGTADTRSTALRDTVENGILVPAQTVDAGGTVTLTITFVMADLPGAVHQGESAGFDLLVAMQTAGAGLPDSPRGDVGTLVPGLSAPDGASGSLAASGVVGVAVLWPLAGVLLGVGAFLAAGRHRVGSP